MISICQNSLAILSSDHHLAFSNSSEYYTTVATHLVSSISRITEINPRIGQYDFSVDTSVYRNFDLQLLHQSIKDELEKRNMNLISFSMNDRSFFTGVKTSTATFHFKLTS